METQFDTKVRIVSQANLAAMCEAVSGMCHRFELVVVGKSFARVVYLNPDEYGNEHPMTALLPCFPYAGDTVNCEGSPAIVLHIHDVINDNMDGEGWQEFMPLLDAPAMYRDPRDNSWHEVEQVNATKA